MTRSPVVASIWRISCAEGSSDWAFMFILAVLGWLVRVLSFADLGAVPKWPQRFSKSAA